MKDGSDSIREPLRRQKFRAQVAVYAEGAGERLTEAEVASLISRALPFGRALRLSIDPEWVAEVADYQGEPAPERPTLFGERSHG